ncbi:MAG: ABC transporter ATP-binding protein [Mycoplasmatales bacterium]
MAKLLEIKNLNIEFRVFGGTVKAIRGIDLSIEQGEVLALVGESGSGKSVTSKAIMGLLPSSNTEASGEILLDGENIVGMSEENLQFIRGNKAAMIFQDPMTSLNPVVSIGKQIIEALQVRSIKLKNAVFTEMDPIIDATMIDAKSKKAFYKDLEKDPQNHVAIFQKYNISSITQATDLCQRLIEIMEKSTKEYFEFRTKELLKQVGIKDPNSTFKQFPHQLSGGMRQRIVIAIALACEPKLLIADEPTTALDVTIQAQILELIMELKEKLGFAILFITHDLGVVANVADRVAVMYAGRICELGTVEEVFYNPQHPYTWGLIASMPDLDSTSEDRLISIPGTPPNLQNPPVGDAFASRNVYAFEIDFIEQPPMFEVSETHSAATWLLDERAPQVTPPPVIVERRLRYTKIVGGSNE